MKTAEEMSDTLYKHYLEAYNKVQQGEPYPQWDINARWLYEGIQEIIADLTAQLQKAEQDKEAMGKLLKELMANELFIAENHFSPVAAKITECLTQCGITP